MKNFHFMKIIKLCLDFKKQLFQFKEALVLYSTTVRIYPVTYYIIFSLKHLYNLNEHYLRGEEGMLL